MARAVSLSCDNCGAPLSVPNRVRFATCEHCNARLRIERGGGAVFTEVLDAVAKLRSQVSTTAASVRIVELERELESVDEKLAGLHDPGGWSVVWMCVAIGLLGSLGILTDDTEAQAAGVLSLLFFGAVAAYLAAGLPGRIRKYEAERAELQKWRADCVERLDAARASRR